PLSSGPIRSVCVPTTLFSPPGSPSLPALLVVGQNPGVQEDEANEPFVGPTGQLLRTAYLKGLPFTDHATIYLANAVRCHTQGNAKPLTSHISACRPYLLADINHLLASHPSLFILCLGAVALDSIHTLPTLVPHQPSTKLPRQLRTAFNEQPFTLTHPDHPPIYILATYHPAAVLRDGSLRRAVHDHMQILYDTLTLASEPPPSSEPTIVPPSYPPKGDDP
ncbi:MAG: hypothetical protein D6812_12365, partial [Deltaproteobacteria bacterium]